MTSLLTTKNLTQELSHAVASLMGVATYMRAAAHYPNPGSATGLPVNG